MKHEYNTLLYVNGMVGTESCVKCSEQPPKSTANCVLSISKCSYAHFIDGCWYDTLTAAFEMCAESKCQTYIQMKQLLLLFTNICGNWALFLFSAAILTEKRVSLSS